MDQILGFSVSIFSCLCCLVKAIKADCDPHLGPYSALPYNDQACILAEGFNRFQYATCRTGLYEKIGNYKYYCPGAASYCYFTCMLTKHQKKKGPVYDDCSCMPDECFSTDGVDCGWYTHCLKQRYPCSANVPAVHYAEQICNIRTTEKYSFTVVGNRWMRAVQRCIESKINPVLRSKKESSCKTIKDFSTETLLPCFLRSVVDFKSIRLSFSLCDIKYTDWATVLWTINGLKDDTSNPGLKALIDAIGECRDGPQQQGFEFKGNSVDSGMRMIRLTAGKINQELEPAFDSDKYDAVSDSVAKQLAAQLHWEQNGVQWIPFIGSHAMDWRAMDPVHQKLTKLFTGNEMECTGSRLTAAMVTARKQTK